MEDAYSKHTLRIPDRVYQAMERLARRHRRSVTQELVLACELYVEAQWVEIALERDEEGSGSKKGGHSGNMER